MIDESQKIPAQVLITGGTSGIGAEIADLFHDRGWEVTVVSRKSCHNYQHIELDLANESAVCEWMASVDFSKFTTLVNCAGIIHDNSLHDLDMRRAREVFEVNFFSALVLIKGFSNINRRTANSHRIRYVVNIASIAGLVAKKNFSIYASSKFALKGLTRSLAVELAPQNVLVNSISPGPTDTPMLRKSLSSEAISRLVEITPLKRLPSSATIARAAYFFGSNENSCITGQDLIIDSGLSVV